MNGFTSWLSHPATRSGLAVAVGYGLVLVALTILLFLLPYAIFRGF